MLYNSPSRGPLDISTLNQWDLTYHIRKFRQERDLAQQGAAMQNFGHAKELAEMERVAKERGVVVE
jgi:hypothetical protein